MFLSFSDGHGVVELFLWSRGDSWKLTRGLADVCYNNLALGRNLPHVTWREAFIAKRAPEKRSAWSFCTCCSTCSSALTGLSLSSLRTPHGGHRVSEALPDSVSSRFPNCMAHIYAQTGDHIPRGLIVCSASAPASPGPDAP